MNFDENENLGENIGQTEELAGHAEENAEETRSEKPEEISGDVVSAQDEIPENAEASAKKTAENGDTVQPQKEKSKPFENVMDWLCSIVYTAAAVVLLGVFGFRVITVSGDSMNDTLQNSDKVITTSFFYTPQRGDIVVVYANKMPNTMTEKFGEPIIKRVIAIEGDEIKFDFDRGEVWLKKAGSSDFELLEEDFIKDKTTSHHVGWMTSGEVCKVPENCVFVLGDNRNNSWDSRDLKKVGVIDRNYIMGKAFVRAYPFDAFKGL